MAMAIACLLLKGQVNDEIIRQVHPLPLTVVFLKLYGIGAGIMYGICLGEIIEILCSAPEILLLVGGMAKGEMPVGIKIYPLAQRRRYVGRNV